MAITDKNTIKKWFRNFLKPTQEQFWNWMDSYWHKEEKIPQDTIEGWDEFLQSLPTQGTLQNYLLKDGSNLSDDEKTDFTTAINALTHDHEKEGETIKGTGYTKAQVDTLLDNIDLTTKADKNAENLVENDIEKWREKLGIEEVSNLSNNNQTILPNVIREIDVQGRLDFKNISLKESEDVTFSEKLVVNADGTLAKKTDLPIVNLQFTFPQEVSVNHIYPNWTKPDSYQLQIQHALESWKSEEGWKAVPENFWRVETLDNRKPEAAKLLNEGRGFELKYDKELDNYYETTNKLKPVMLAETKDFIFKKNENVAIKFLVEDHKRIGRAVGFFTFYGTKTQNQNGKNRLELGLSGGVYGQGHYRRSSINKNYFYLYKIENSIIVIAYAPYATGNLGLPDKNLSVTQYTLADDNYKLRFENPQAKITQVKVNRI